ncbi:MAG: 2-hydroxyacyl-CoA dehydratase family protein [Sphaerochaetaceae bacterium]|nr:2-hydroxyacyl-CoA dehydratase family protein [Sphaerochaetaceae bacterium]
MNKTELFKPFYNLANNPKEIKDRYLKEGKKIVLVAPVYTPEEIAHSMGLVPMGAWGADVEINDAKEYFPTFYCSIAQSLLQLGMNKKYQGVSAVLIPHLCDTLKCLGQNWKAAVEDVPFIPVAYPQNRKADFGIKYTYKVYESVIEALEKATGEKFDEAKLKDSIEVYNAHNDAMRRFAVLCSKHSDVSATDRSAVFKSATFVLKEEHTKMVNDLIDAISKEDEVSDKTKIYTTGILADQKAFLEILDKNNLQIVADDVAAETRQYRTDAEVKDAALQSLSEKWANMDNCSVLYDPKLNRVNYIVEQAKKYDAKGILLVMTKFCDPEEFDYPAIKKACEEANMPLVQVEVDRQTKEYGQAETLIETFKDMLN